MTNSDARCAFRSTDLAARYTWLPPRRETEFRMIVQSEMSASFLGVLQLLTGTQLISRFPLFDGDQTGQWCLRLSALVTDREVE